MKNQTKCPTRHYSPFFATLQGSRIPAILMMLVLSGCVDNYDSAGGIDARASAGDTDDDFPIGRSLECEEAYLEGFDQEDGGWECDENEWEEWGNEDPTDDHLEVDGGRRSYSDS